MASSSTYDLGKEGGDCRHQQTGVVGKEGPASSHLLIFQDLANDVYVETPDFS